MSHNKMYREIEGYEDALYLTHETIDELDEASHAITYGESVSDVRKKIEKVENLISKIKEKISDN